jgi:hypothetical protein
VASYRGRHEDDARPASKLTGLPGTIVAGFFTHSPIGVGIGRPFREHLVEGATRMDAELAAARAAYAAWKSSDRAAWIYISTTT